MNFEVRNKIIFDIQKKIVDIMNMYDSKGLNLTFSVYKKDMQPEKIKVKIEEIY